MGRARLLAGLGPVVVFGLGCGTAHAAHVTAAVVAHVPLECAVSPFMVRGETPTSISGVFNEGCNAPGGYEVYATIPDGAQVEAMDFYDPAPSTGVVKVSASASAGVRQRSLKISFSGPALNAGEIRLSIVPR